MAVSRQRSNWDTTAAWLCMYATSKSSRASKTVSDYNPFRKEDDQIVHLSTKDGIKILCQALKETK